MNKNYFKDIITGLGTILGALLLLLIVAQTSTFNTRPIAPTAPTHPTAQVPPAGFRASCTSSSECQKSDQQLFCFTDDGQELSEPVANVKGKCLIKDPQLSSCNAPFTIKVKPGNPPDCKFEITYRDQTYLYPDGPMLRVNSGDLLHIRSTSVDPDGHKLTYSWQIDGYSSSQSEFDYQVPASILTDPKSIVLSVTDGFTEPVVCSGALKTYPSSCQPQSLQARGVGLFPDLQSGMFQAVDSDNISESYLVWNILNEEDTQVKLNGTTLTGTSVAQIQNTDNSNYISWIDYSQATQALLQNTQSPQISQVGSTEDRRTNGAGLIVKYLSNNRDNDFSYLDWVNPVNDYFYGGIARGPQDEWNSDIYTLKVPAATYDRVARLIVMVGGSDSTRFRPENFWYAVSDKPLPDSVDPSQDTIFNNSQLDGFFTLPPLAFDNFAEHVDGPEWDTLKLLVDIPAVSSPDTDSQYLYLQIESPHEGNGESLVLAWYALEASCEPAAKPAPSVEEQRIKHPPYTPFLGDVNKDEQVDAADLSIVVSYIGKDCNFMTCLGDSNIDGVTNGADVADVIVNWTD